MNQCVIRRPLIAMAAIAGLAAAAAVSAPAATINVLPTIDTYLQGGGTAGEGGDAPHGSDDRLEWDLGVGGTGNPQDVQQTLLFFEIDAATLDFFRLDPAATAVLTIEIEDQGNEGVFHLMTVDWITSPGGGDLVTYNNIPDGLGGSGGGVVPGNNAEIMSTAGFGNVDAMDATGLGMFTADVTADVRAWADGTANNGWAVLATGSGGVSTSSAETMMGTPPTLTLSLVVPEPSSIVPAALALLSVLAIGYTRRRMILSLRERCEEV